VAPGLKKIDDATAIRRRILTAFEQAEATDDHEARRRLLTFVVIGGGPTGVEMAGAIAELARVALRHDFRNIDPAEASIVLVEAGPRVLAAFPPTLSAAAQRALERLGVEVRLGTPVTCCDEQGVTIGDQRLAAATIIWAAGVSASSAARWLGVEMDRVGRVMVEADLTLPGHPEIFVIGDAAVEPWKEGRPTPGVAQGAIQGGSYASRVIRRRLSGEPTQPFRYSNHGDVAVIGRLAGVTDIPWLGPFGKQSGFVAWALWLLIHIAYLIGFANRVIVVTRWGWSFFTHGRGSRLITGEPLLPPIDTPEPPA
jgi:NADH:ubiquinone reductase (H+-translocating)